jgi:hypothetical protein
MRDGKALQVWMALLADAFYEDGVAVRKGRVFKVKRGQVLTSCAQLGRSLELDRQTVARKLDSLVHMDCVKQELIQDSIQIGTLITILNFDEYQSTSESRRYKGATAGATADATADATTNKKRRNSRRQEIKESLSESPPAPESESAQHLNIMKAWEELKGSMPAAKLTKGREQTMRERWKERPDLEFWRKAVTNLATSEYAQRFGTLDWVIKCEDNAVKAYEGNYNRKLQLVADKPVVKTRDTQLL